MKKYIVLAALSMVLTLGLNAQVGSYNFSSSDGFFNSHANEDIETREASDWGAMPRIFGHGLTENQNAPVGSGLLLLAGMGLAYGVRRKMKTEN